VALRKEKNAEKVQDLKKGCVATLAAGGSDAGAQTGPASSGTLTWPPKVTPGQVWTVKIDGLTAWTLNFNEVDKDGYPTGPATQGSKKFIAVALKYDDGWFGFAMVDDSGIYFCDFENDQSVNGLRLVKGIALRREKGADKSQDLKKACTATLTSGNPGSVPGSGASMGLHASNDSLEMALNPFAALNQILARIY
jgi:hypothetical protein